MKNSITANANPFHKFKDKVDWFIWENYYDQVETLEMSASDQTRARASLAILRELLGEDFLINSHEHFNPLFGYFLKAAPSARFSLIQIAEALDYLRGAAKFDGLVSQLKNPVEVEAAITVLEPAYRLARAGFLIEFDPIFTVTDRKGVERQPKPDILATDVESGTQFVVEVSRLLPKPEQISSARTFQVLFNIVQDAMFSHPEARDLSDPRYPLVYVQFARPLSDAQLQEVDVRVRKLVEAVRTSNQFVEILDDSVEVAVFPEGEHARAGEWAAVRGMIGHVQGPPIRSDEVRRATFKLSAKTDQMPRDLPGIVIIPVRSLMFYLHGLQNIIHDVENEIRCLPNVCLALLSHTFVTSDRIESAAIVSKGLAAYRLSNEDLSTEEGVVIGNSACGLEIPLPVLDRIRRALIKYGDGCGKDIL